MSDRIEIEIDPRAKKRLIRWGIVFGILLLFLTFGSAFVNTFADYLWYRFDAEAPVVFSTQLKTRLLLLAIGLVVSTPILLINARAALTAAEVAGRAPRTAVDAAVEQLLGAIDRARSGLKKGVLYVAPVLGLIYGISLAARWEDWLLYQNAVLFGKADPVFGNDISFYVFKLSLLQGIQGWLWALWLLCAIVAVAVFFGVGSIVATGRQALGAKVMRTQLAILASSGFAILGWGAWLSRYDSLFAVHERFAGPGHADLVGVGAMGFLAYILWFFAIASMFTLRVSTPIVVAGAGAAVSALTFIFGVVIAPGFTQTYRVNPNELRLQTPYLARGIEATRWAYALDKISVVPFEAQVAPDRQALESAEATFVNLRLWDPTLLQKNVNVRQALRDYFVFPDIDVDRYVIDGEQRLVMVGAREIDVEGLDPSRRGWQNIHMQYTHGSGIVAVAVNEATPDGMPVYLLKDVPPVGRPELRVDEPRIYFGDSFRSDGDYIFVGTRLAEFDYLGGAEVEHRWQGKRGVPISGGLSKIVFAWVLGDRDLLFTQDITSDSRLLWRRNIRTRAAKLVPFVRWDRDPYITIVDGRLLWIMDGYTMTDKIPYSQPTAIERGRFNYMRNSVKLTIDAYTGDWNAYITEPNDPIIRAYDRIYPGILQSADNAPNGVRAHFRYPEDLFSVQSMQLSRYHVTDVTRFFRGEDAWQIPRVSGQERQLPPYYVQMKLPDDEIARFMLILPFTPIGRPNMIGWLAAHCDPDRYGELTLYSFQGNQNVIGPEQQEAQLQTEPDLSARLTLLGQFGSRVLPGNMLVIPVGNSVVYSKTMFLEAARAEGAITPQLRIVVMAAGDNVVFADTYQQALDKLLAVLGAAAPTIPKEEAPTQPQETAPPTEQRLPAESMAIEKLRQALRALDEADVALRNGDWSAYGEAQKRARALLEEAARSNN
ncbi:MAG: UPF0182 family protein [Fimbriimonadales bacterium]|nr:UPF0182 family protein [Fimbriimonadales bacterium]